MTPVEIESLMVPVPGADACGPNLEYDAQFAALERTATPRAEQQIGSTILKAEEPDWASVERQTRALLARTKDLRLGLQLTRALLRTAGWEGFAAGLTVLRNLVEEHWEDAHPRLDSDDGKDVTARLNILAGLADQATLAAVRSSPLVSSRVAGRFSLRDIEVAAGDALMASEVGTPLTMLAIEAVANAVDLADLEAVARAVSVSRQMTASIDATFNDKAAQGLSLGALPTLLGTADAFLEARLTARRPTTGAERAGAPVDGVGAQVRVGGGRAGGEISSREDVIRVLDRVIAYYAQHEPSSPIPMFIERCKRLVTMSFIDIVRELAPDGMPQIEKLRG
jgi:type VI secretion system protein ImpA